MSEIGGQWDCVITARPAPHQKDSSLPRFIALSGALVLLLLLLTMLVGRITHPTVRITLLSPWARPLVLFGLLWAFLELILLAYKTLLWFQYRPISPVTESNAPRLTVIIPAYNEGPMVAKSIVSVIDAAYPRDRLDIIVVDDGSVDDTWEHIARIANRYPDAVTAVRFPENRGKRAALMEGFKRAKGEVAVTIDSDSVIAGDTLLSIASPFVDERVGAVAGKVQVHNRDAGLIPRMLQVAYILSFDFVRAAQSQYRNVYCCPGALAAYRLSAVRAVLGAWSQQRFLGAPCTYGEDRAMSNYILGLGLDILYQNNAVVYTVVPTCYGKLCRMFLRWYRSFVREDIRLLTGVVWKRPVKPRVATLIDKAITDIRYPLRYVLCGFALQIAMHSPTIIPSLVMGIAIASTLSVMYYLKSDPSWRCLYASIYGYCAMLALWWILPYAAVTLRSRSWMTR